MAKVIILMADYGNDPTGNDIAVSLVCDLPIMQKRRYPGEYSKMPILPHISLRKMAKSPLVTR
jgi:hypothetical protein